MASRRRYDSSTESDDDVTPPPRNDNRRGNQEVENQSSEEDREWYSDETDSDEEPLSARHPSLSRNPRTPSNDSESDEEESDVEPEHNTVDLIKSMLDDLRADYDRILQRKLDEFEQQKNRELEEFRRQEEDFRNEIAALRQERVHNVEIIEELRREMADQRISFEQTIHDILG